jgi:hypothetical protein
MMRVEGRYLEAFTTFDDIARENKQVIENIIHTCYTLVVDTGMHACPHTAVQLAIKMPLMLFESS